MNKLLSISSSRILAAFLVVVLVYSPLFPIFTYAQTIDDRICQRNGGTWNGVSCDMPPTIAVHGDVSAQATSDSGVAVSYVSPATSDDVDAPGTASCTPLSDSTFPAGTTLVTCTATDSAGNSASPVSFNVIVAPYVAPDTTPPAIAPHDDVNAQATDASGTAVTYSSPATSDNVDPAGTASCAPPSGSAFVVGTTTVTCTAADAAGNSATSTTFSVVVALAAPAATSASSGSGSQGGGAGGGGGGATASTTPSTPPPPDPSTQSTSSTNSAVVPPAQSNTDNTDFQNINNGGAASPCDPSVPGCVKDMSATSTEALAIDPLFKVATSTDGTGSKIGGTIFTGSAAASTTVKNVLNITRSNVDGPGVTNSSIITADTDNAGTVTTQDDTRAQTGDNSGQGGEGDATIHTGKAVSSAQVLNVVNTNFFNSNGLVLFLNPQNGDSLDLRSANLSYFLTGGVGASPTQLGCTVLTCLNSASLKVLNKNEGTVNNNVLVRAATGGNSATSTKAGGIDIATGNAYASADVLNMVNTNFINSKYLVATFDNFGSMQGDVVLPDAAFFDTFFRNGNTLPDLNSSSYIVSNDNHETFSGTTTARALTGGNIATTTTPGQGHGEVTTGHAYTSSNSYTAANQTHVGGSSALFVFHVSGTWSGTVKGLPAGMSSRRTDYGIEVYSTGTNSSSGTQGVYNSATFIASSTNKASVQTDVNVSAETGNNQALTEDGTGAIKTGDAYASANVVNMVNTNVVNRNFMFVVFNIAGDWSGDIDFGGHSPNLKVTATETPTPTTSGSDVAYHFTVANNGDVPASNVVLSAKYNKSLLFLSRSSALSTDTSAGTQWNLGAVAPGETQQIDATGRVFAPGLLSGFSMTLPLIATVSSTERDQDISDNTQDVSVVVSSSPPASGSGTGSTGGSGGSTDPRDRGGSGSGGTTTSGGGGAPPPSGGGGGGSPPSSSGGVGGNPAGSPGGGGGPPPSSAANANSSPGDTNAGNSSGGGGGGGAGVPGAYGTLGGLAANAITPNPILTSIKTGSVGTTTAPATVDYKVVIDNDKSAGPLYKAFLNDTLYDPSGHLVVAHSWNLDYIAPGDEIRLTYSAAFASTTKPGVYHNVARVTGYRANAWDIFGGRPITPLDATSTVVILPNGQVLGEATSTVGFSPSDLQITRYACAPLLTATLKQGSTNKTEVMKLQSFLNTQGSNLPLTGVFGPLTAAAVRSFQRKYPADIASPTGIVDAATMRKINTIVCGGADPSASAASASGAISTPGALSLSPTKPKAPAKSKKHSSQGSGLINSIGGLFSKFRW